jgi:hypothetical protein
MHLLEFITSRHCRERMRNWSEVARAMLPGSLKPHMLEYEGEEPDTPLANRVRELRRNSSEAVRELVAAWGQTPDRPAPLRVALPLEWMGDGGGLLEFNCFLN